MGGGEGRGSANSFFLANSFFCALEAGFLGLLIKVLPGHYVSDFLLLPLFILHRSLPASLPTKPVNRAPAPGIGPPTYSPRPEMTGFRLDPGAYTVVSLAGRGLGQAGTVPSARPIGATRSIGRRALILEVCLRTQDCRLGIHRKFPPYFGTCL